ncbi:MAG: methylmalonyl-CoA mutase family protein, partial [Rhizomicrobium sp.]
TELSPLTADSGHFMVVEKSAEREQVARLHAWRAARDADEARSSLAELARAAQAGENIMPFSIACARAGVTTGEWAQTLRHIFGEYRAPTGVAADAPARNDERIVALRECVKQTSARLGRRLTLLVAKPGLDGHSNGAEQIAIRARDAGMEVIYDGIRFTPDDIVAAACARQPHVLGLSILSGSHVPLACEVMEKLAASGLSHVKVVVGGIIPPEDEARLAQAGIAAVFSPKDFDLDAITREIAALARE